MVLGLRVLVSRSKQMFVLLQKSTVRVQQHVSGKSRIIEPMSAILYSNQYEMAFMRPP